MHLKTKRNVVDYSLALGELVHRNSPSCGKANFGHTVQYQKTKMSTVTPYSKVETSPTVTTQFLRGSSHRRHSPCLAILLLCMLPSCVPLESMIYLQDDTSKVQGIVSNDDQLYRLHINDIIDVRITSLSPEVNALFGTSTQGANVIAQATALNGGDLFFLTGYNVNEDGNIDIPYIGEVRVAGFTVDEAREKIDERIAVLFNNYHLSVRLGGVRFSTIGEFNKPGKHSVLQNQVTIFEAIATGGDLTQVANRGQLQLIRQHPTGAQIHSINLLSADIIAQPFYYIQPNDVLYAPPMRQKSWGVGITGANTLATVLGAISTSSALLLSIISLNR